MAQKRNNEEWIRLCKEIHGDKVDYSETNFDKRDEKGRVKFICPIHGEFWQKPTNHYNLKQGCPKCNGGVKHTTEDFIKKSKKMYGEDTLIYDRVNYINENTEVEIGCKIHGYFKVKPVQHLNKYLKVSCPYCKNRIDIEKTFKELKEKYDDEIHTLVNYEKDNQNGYKYFININCKLHGNFKIRLDHLLNKKEGICKDCDIMHTKQNKEAQRALYLEEHKIVVKDRYSFIWLSRQYHGQNKYKYHKVNYVNQSTYVELYCNNHNDYFKVNPHRHLLKDKLVGCSYCYGSYEYKDTNDWIEKNVSKELLEKYDFSHAVYKGKDVPMEIICKEHGSFWRYPSFIKKGTIVCEKCSKSYFEEIICDILSKYNVNFIEQCGRENFNWLDRLKLDFYLLDYNIAIECQGRQHFGFGGWSKDENKLSEFFKEYKKRDERKKKLCKDNDINLIYFLNEKYVEYLDKDNIYFTNTDDLIKYILSQPIVNNNNNLVDAEPLLLENKDETTN